MDEHYVSWWKTIEILALTKFHPNIDILWKSHAPENTLKNIRCSQLADSIRVWYVFREYLSLCLTGKKFSDTGACQYLWFNRNIRSRSKQSLYYEDWYEKKICLINDLLNPHHPGHKLFEELVLDFRISIKDRRKYNFLVKNIPDTWIQEPNNDDLDLHDTMILELLNAKKVPKYAYDVMMETVLPLKRYDFWQKSIPDIPMNVDWMEVHTCNYSSCIATRFC